LGGGGDLREIDFEDGASPQMGRIEINCSRLVPKIKGINYLPELKETEINSAKVGWSGLLHEEVRAHPNKPVLRLRHMSNPHDFPQFLPDDTEKGSLTASDRSVLSFSEAPACYQQIKDALPLTEFVSFLVFTVKPSG
jgi:hypothetical protein